MQNFKSFAIAAVVMAFNAFVLLELELQQFVRVFIPKDSRG